MAFQRAHMNRRIPLLPQNRAKTTFSGNFVNRSGKPPIIVKKTDIWLKEAPFGEHPYEMLNQKLFSQLRRIRLDVNGDVDRTRDLLIQGLFQTFGYFVRGSDIQIRVNEDVQVEKNFPADRTGP